jgi:hypothetical protein
MAKESGIVLFSGIGCGKRPEQQRRFRYLKPSNTFRPLFRFGHHWFTGRGNVQAYFRLRERHSLCHFEPSL